MQKPQQLIELDIDQRPASASEISAQLESIASSGDGAMALSRGAGRLAQADKRRYKRFRTDMGVTMNLVEVDDEEKRNQLARLDNLFLTSSLLLSHLIIFSSHRLR